MHRSSISYITTSFNFQELTLSLMQQAASVLHSSTGIVSERISLVCEVITNVAQCDNENVKTILNSSGCLKNILSVFSNIDMTKVRTFQQEINSVEIRVFIL